MASPGIVRCVLLAGLFVATLFAGLHRSAGAAWQETPQTGALINMQLVLDSSGSMSEEIEPGVTRIDAAREALSAVIDALPQSADVNVGLRVYGHKGTNTEAGRAESCLSSELRVPVLGVDTDALHAEVAAYQPVGWTPLALSLLSADNDFPLGGEGVENHILVLTDGLETCGGDPCTAARQLKNGPKAITTHVIGMNLIPEDQEGLQCVADASDGSLLATQNAEELRIGLFEILEMLDVIKTTGFLEIEQFGGVFPQATATRELEASEEVASGTPVAVEGETTFSFTTENVIEVPAGRYTVAWINPSGTESGITVVVTAGETTFIRGSMLRLPISEGELYELTAIDGTVIWIDSVEFGDAVWVLPGTYRLEVEGPGSNTVVLSMLVQTFPGVVTEVTVRTEP